MVYLRMLLIELIIKSETTMLFLEWANASFRSLTDLGKLPRRHAHLVGTINRRI